MIFFFTKTRAQFISLKTIIDNCDDFLKGGVQVTFVIIPFMKNYKGKVANVWLEIHTKYNSEFML